MIFSLNAKNKENTQDEVLTVEHDASINNKPWVSNTSKDGQPVYRFKDGLNYENTPNPYMDDVIEIETGDAFKTGDIAPFIIGVKGAAFGGSRDDILTKGKNVSGSWRVEFARALDTGNQDDVKLDPAKTATFVIVVRDDGKGYAVSRPVTLTLGG
jgi:hypothetical protein